MVLLYGTWHNWPVLVDPSEAYWLAYSQSFLKKLLGTIALRIHNYCLGSVFVVTGLIILWKGLSRS